MNMIHPTITGPSRMLLLPPLFLLEQTPLATMPDGHHQTTQWTTRLLLCALIRCSTQEPAEHDPTLVQSDRAKLEYHKLARLHGHTLVYNMGNSKN